MIDGYERAPTGGKQRQRVKGTEAEVDARNDRDVKELACDEARKGAACELVEDDRKDADADDCRALRKLQQTTHEGVRVAQRLQVWRVVDVELDKIKIEVLGDDGFEAVCEELRDPDWSAVTRAALPPRVRSASCILCHPQGEASSAERRTHPTVDRRNRSDVHLGVWEQLLKVLKEAVLPPLLPVRYRVSRRHARPEDPDTDFLSSKRLLEHPPQPDPRAFVRAREPDVVESILAERICRVQVADLAAGCRDRR